MYIIESLSISLSSVFVLNPVPAMTANIFVFFFLLLRYTLNRRTVLCVFAIINIRLFL